jgi:hypothetical protein
MSDEQKVTALEVLPSKIVQIAADPDSDSTRYGCLALCEDGSVWGGSHKVWPNPETRWFCLSPAHVANETQRKARLWDVMWKLKAVGRIYASVSDHQGQRYADNAEEAADLLERLAGEVKP